jgi:hypothetical protein
LSSTAAAKRLIDQIAIAPRAAGTAEEERARRFCVDYLRSLDFDVRQQTFGYSRLPATWGLPMAGTLLLLTGVALVLWANEGGGGLPQGTATLGALVVVAFWLWFTLSVVRDRSHHSTGINLVATRGGSAPDIWLVAHLDSKSQPFPTLVRTIGVLLAIATTLALISFYFIDMLITDSTNIWMVLGIAATVASLPLLASTIGNDSPGAVDNASGVAAVLRAVAETPGRPIGVLLTSAEELGLAGARAWARNADGVSDNHSAPKMIINCDTLDDAGPMRCVYHRKAEDPLARELAQRAAGLGVRMKLTRRTPGILLDSVSLARAGLPAVTLSRVTFGTLARIHTSRDTADRLSGDGATQAAAIMAAAIEARS